MASEARQRALAEFEHWCPNVYGNPFMVEWPTPKQALVLALHGYEDMSGGILYGGAAGPGKSSLILQAAAQYAWKNPDFAALLLRRTHTDLMQPGALLDRAIKWWHGKARYDAQNKIFHFPGGGKVAFAYLSKPNDELRYQSAEYQLIAWDELTQWPDDRPFRYLLSRLRRPAGSTLPLRCIAASNPGGPGHEWVKARFIGERDFETGKRRGAECRYIPGKLSDNPHIDRDAYVRTLMHLHPTDRERLLNGDWDVLEPSDYFQVPWFGPFLDPEEDAVATRDKVVVRWWDLAASKKEDAAYTAGVKMARFRRGARAIEHAVSFRETPGKRDARILQTAQADGHHCYVGIEIEPGSGGPAQFETLSKMLRKHGFRAVGARPKAELSDSEGAMLSKSSASDDGKQRRCVPVASCLERGYQRRGESEDEGNENIPWWGEDRNARSVKEERDGLRIYAGPWTHAYLDRVCGFPETGKDEADATSGAWAWLEAHPFGLGVPPRAKEKAALGDLKDVHPADRPDPGEIGKDRGGHWRP